MGARYGYDEGMRLTRVLFLFFLAFACLCAREYGPPKGSRMPGFDLPDQDGKLRSLNSLLGPKGAVILFFRSADW